MTRISLLIVAFVVLFVPARARADATCTPIVPFSGTDWPDQTVAAASAKADEIAALEQYMFTLVGKDSDRKGIRTDGLIIIQNGAILYERYARGFNATNKHLEWSVSKSLTHALVGIATENGVSTSDSICKYLPKLPKESCNVTIMNLMEMASGFYWNEEYENESNQASSVLAMLYGEGHNDMATFVASQSARYSPGSTWYYSTGDATLLGGVLDAALQSKLGKYWEWPYFFNKIGITNTTLERDRAGHSMGGSYWWAIPRDMARLGFLYLNNGCWNGDQVLPADWSQNASTLASPMQTGKTLGRSPGDVYGRLWWLNIPAPAVGQTTPPFPDVPTDIYYADGHWGQFIVVVPSKAMVIVRTGDDRDASALDLNKFFSLAIAVGH